MITYMFLIKDIGDMSRMPLTHYDTAHLSVFFLLSHPGLSGGKFENID